jgi:hypothetical protein
VSRRLPRLSLRFVVAAALLSCLVCALPFRGQVHAATQPQTCGVIPSSGTLSLPKYGTFTGSPGATICVGANGVITASGATGPVLVNPSSGYALARFNRATVQWEAVTGNSIPLGTGTTYALIRGKSVVIPSSGQLLLANGTVTGQPGAAIVVGSNGEITVSGTTEPVQVTPKSGYVLAVLNTTTGRWEAVPNNTIPPGTGATYALISGQPVTIPSSGRMMLANGTVTGKPGTAVTVGPNGVISMSGATGPVQVSPSTGYVLAAYNTTTRQWEAVPNNTMLPGPGSYTLIPSNRVPHISSLRVQLGRVSGGRTTACKIPRNAKGPVPSGCQIVTITAPARSRLSVTVRYTGTRKTQHFVVTADAHGRYRGAFPVQYNPPARNKRGVTVTVTVVDTLPDGAYGGKKTIKFVAMPRPTRGTRH